MYDDPVIIIGNWVKMIKLLKIFTFGTNIERCCETDTESNKTLNVWMPRELGSPGRCTLRTKCLARLNT